MIKGFHDLPSTSESHGFYDEVIHKYGNAHVWQWVSNALMYLPLAALVDGCYYALHSGFSDKIPLTLDAVRGLDRCIFDPNDDSAVFNMLTFCPNEETQERWVLESRDFTYGHAVVKEFHHLNNSTLAIRSFRLAG